MQTSATCQNSLSDPICVSIVGAPFNTQAQTNVMPGWTVGSGLELKVMGGLLLRGEYRFAQFSNNNGITFPAPSGPQSGPTTLNYRLNVNTQLATAGLAYKFNGF